MSANIMREAAKAMRGDILLTPKTPEPAHLSGKIEEANPQDAIDKFGEQPSLIYTLRNYMEFRGVENLSISMLSRFSGLENSRLHRYFKTGKYARLDNIIEGFKEDNPDWREYKTKYSKIRRDNIANRVTKENLETLKKYPTLKDYIKGKGVKLKICDLEYFGSITRTTAYHWHKTANFEKLDAVIDKAVFRKRGEL